MADIIGLRWKLHLLWSSNYFSGFKQNLVPLFQRPYTWSEKQWRTLWEDVMVFYPSDDVSDKATHFMGAVVTMPACGC
jgi:uncharacterized protein with ParB-like and HNH nuclease domain